MTAKTSATEALHTSGYRLTMQRQIVWDSLRQAKKHLSAEDLLGQIRRQYPRFNMATIYRSLEVLEELGLIKETRIGDRGYYELAEEGQDHYHLVCDRCGLVEDFTLSKGLETSLESALAKTASKRGLAVVGHRVDVHGLCHDCQGGRKSRGPS